MSSPTGPCSRPTTWPTRGFPEAVCCSVHVMLFPVQMPPASNTHILPNAPPPPHTPLPPFFTCFQIAFWDVRCTLPFSLDFALTLSCPSGSVPYWSSFPHFLSLVASCFTSFHWYWQRLLSPGRFICLLPFQASILEHEWIPSLLKTL